MAEITEARMRITAQDDTAGAFQSMKDRVGGLMSEFGRLNGVLGAFGAALSVGAITAFVRNTVDAAARLDDMAEATGASVEELSRLSQIARIGGHDLGTVETAMLRLTKAVSDGSTVQKSAFEAIGLSIKQMHALNADEQIETVAAALAQFEDDANKAAVGVALFGKAWKDIAPLLKDIVEQQGVQATVTAEQAAEAEKLQKSWAALAVQAEELGRSIALGLIDPMRVAFALLGDTVANILDTVGTFGEVAKKALSLDFQGALSARDAFRGRVAGREAATISMMEEIANPTGRVVGAAGRRIGTFSAPDPEAEQAKKGELKRLADYQRQIEADELEAQKRNMREEDRLLKERFKLEEEVREAEKDYWVEKIDREIEFERELGEQKHQAALQVVKDQERAAEESRRAWERQFDIISESLTDALMRGFESGKDFAENFADTLKNMFKSLVLRPVIQAIVAPVAGAVTGMLGSFLPGVAQASTGTMGGGGSGIGSLFNVFSNGGMGGWGGMAGAITGLGGSFFGGVGGALGNLAIEGIGAGLAGNLSAAGIALGSGNIAGGLGTLLGTLGPIAGVGLGIASLLGGFGSKGGPASYSGSSYYGNIWQGRQDITDTGITATSRNSKESFAWGMPENWMGIEDLMRSQFLKLQDQIINAAETAGIAGARDRLQAGVYNFSVSTGLQFGEGAEADMVQQALRGISEQMVSELLPNLEAFREGTESLTETFVRMTSRIAGLEAFKQSLNLLDFQAPQVRVSTALDQLQDVFGRAMGGDATAINAFSGAAQQALAIGRDVYAGGAPFGDIFREVNRMIDALIARDRDALTGTGATSMAIAQSGADQVAAIQSQTTTLAGELQTISALLRRAIGGGTSVRAI